MSEAVDSRLAAAGSGPGEPFMVGRTVSAALAILQKRFAKFALLTALAQAPALVVALVAFAIPDATKAANIIEPLLSFLADPIATGTCLFGAYRVMQGRDFTFGESLSVALSRFWPLLGAALLGALLFVLLLLLLIVPGVIYLCMIAVASPACVIERLGPITSLRRSGELTKGYRWKIFSLLIFLFVTSAIANVCAVKVARIVIGDLAGLLTSFATEVLVGALNSTLFAAAYVNLRATKEGVDLDQLARVFD